MNYFESEEQLDARLEKQRSEFYAKLEKLDRIFWIKFVIVIISIQLSFLALAATVKDCAYLFMAMPVCACSVIWYIHVVRWVRSAYRQIKP
jgi:hypothetical protein